MNNNKIDNLYELIWVNLNGGLQNQLSTSGMNVLHEPLWLRLKDDIWDSLWDQLTDDCRN